VKIGASWFIADLQDAAKHSAATIRPQARVEACAREVSPSHSSPSPARGGCTATRTTHSPNLTSPASSHQLQKLTAHAGSLQLRFSSSSPRCLHWLSPLAARGIGVQQCAAMTRRLEYPTLSTRRESRKTSDTTSVQRRCDHAANHRASEWRRNSASRCRARR